MAPKNNPESSANPTSTKPSTSATTSVLGPSSVGAVPASLNTAPAHSAAAPGLITEPSASVTTLATSDPAHPTIVPDPATASLASSTTPSNSANRHIALAPTPATLSLASDNDTTTTTATRFSTTEAPIVPGAAGASLSHPALTNAAAAPVSGASHPVPTTTFITVRLLASPPNSGANFSTYLKDLKISAFDRTVYNTSPDLITGANDVPLGSTTGVAAVGEALTVTQTTGAHPRETLTPSIVQHCWLKTDLSPYIHDGAPVLLSIATAVIVVNISPTTIPFPHPEYPVPSAYDIRLEVSRNGFTLPTPAIEYNVQATSIPFGSLSTLQAAYMLVNAPSMYYLLPAPPPASAKPDESLTLDPGGQPPNFDRLVKAINKVLAKDSPSTAPSLKRQTVPLTVAQCGEIASEIVYDRDILPLPTPVPLYPPPKTPPHAPPGVKIPSLADLYTEPNSDMDNLRQTFEAALTSYHSTNDAVASKLAAFVYAASMAVDSEQRSAAASTAGFTFPVDPSIATNNATIDVVLTASDPSNPPITGTLNPSFVVPAAYFYALGTSFPAQLTPAQRYQAIVTSTQANVASKLGLAVTNQVLMATETTITVATPVTIDASQAVRRLGALSAAVVNSPDPKVYCTGPVAQLVTDWLNKPDSKADPTDFAAFDAAFWTTSELDTPEYLNLILQVVANGNANLVNAILGIAPDAKVLPISKAADLKHITNADWLNFFSTGTYYTAPNTTALPNSQLLPAYTQPGSIAQQVQAFITYIQKLFTVGFSASSSSTGPGGNIPAFGSNGITEVLEAFMNSYASGGTFSFANTIEPTLTATTVSNLFPGDTKTQTWVTNAIMSISTLYQMTKTVSTTNQQLQFSCMEALYARGFVSAASVLSMSSSQFQLALTGTVAYSDALTIYSAAGTANTPVDTSPAAGFQPCNDGSLVDCIPPCNLSPFGPVEYLYEILQLASGPQSLGTLVSSRRGPIGNLFASMANVETRIPQIDLVLESLESIGGNLANNFGAINNTEDIIVAGFTLGKGTDAFGPDAIFSVIPEYSSPAVQPTTSAVYTQLESTCTAPDLPYSQSLDICRSYASKLGTDRFELMRHFRRDITEFALDPPQEPTGFQRQLWRLPVRLDIALEYLQISQEEYTALFFGTITSVLVSKLYGIDRGRGGADQISVPFFLEATGLTYCEFLELWKSGFLSFGRQSSDIRSTLRETSIAASQQEQDSDMAFPECLPCCPQALIIFFGRNTDVDNVFKPLAELIIFIRLWKKLQLRCHHQITFARLADICAVLNLFGSVNSEELQINPDFIRQLAALLMLQERFCLPWTDEDVHSTVVGAERTTLLGIWVDPTVYPAVHSWAVAALLSHLQIYAEKHFKCYRGPPDSLKILSDNLVELSMLAGFTASYPWTFKPTCTIRMAEVLAKICASPFTVGEIIFLFTVQEHLDGDDPFPLTSKAEAHDEPLCYPLDRNHNLSILRERLLKAEVGDCSNRTWYRIESVIRNLGLYSTATTPDPLNALGEHFFPEAMEKLGHPVSPDKRRFAVNLSSSSTTLHVWSSQPCESFHYSSDNNAVNSGQLWVYLPLRDEEVFKKLRDTRQLSTAEISAVRELYFAPRAALAPFALLFSNFNHAVDILIQEPCEEKRFEFFRDQVMLFQRRCEIISEYVSAHVQEVTESHDHEKKPDPEVAWRILKSLIADENSSTLWENDNGAPPTQFDWDPLFSGSAFAAILGLVGTGLFGHYETDSATSWAEMRGGMCAFGYERDEWNEPVPTIIPSLSITPDVAQKKYVMFDNGLAMRDEYGEHLNGAQPFKAVWTGKLLICHTGEYEFQAEEKFKECCSNQLLVTMIQGQRSWTIINYGSSGDHKEHCGPVLLRTGAYTVTVTFTQTEPRFVDQNDVRKYSTGFEVKYKGPDTCDSLEVVPFSSLIQDFKSGPLNSGIEIEGSAGQFLQLQYVSSLRDIRRTYQRAFKAVLFAHRFHLSAKELHCDNQSELGFMLDHADRFVGSSYYQPAASSVFQQHEAYFDFNFLPVYDPYYPPAQDSRANPAPQRQAAIFDWWERIFDYVQLRTEVKEIRKRQIWLMFEDVAMQQPTSADQLVRYLEIDSDLAPLVLTYFATPLYQVVPTDLLDERWAIRLWHCGCWIRWVQRSFYTEIMDKALPALWACDDPGLPVGATTGNHNLTYFVQHSFLDQKGVPHRFKELRSLNNGLRERARRALFAYLCNMSRVALPTPASSTNAYATSPRDLSDLLLQDVETGLSESTSRIDDAIHAVQTFVHRARVGLEPSFTPTYSFIEEWENSFASFESWTSWKRRSVYRENWIQWEEMQKMESYEGFEFFRNQLRRDVLTMAEPGRPMWWESPDFSTGSTLQALQTRDLGSFEVQQGATQEGLTLIGTPLNDGQPSWLAPISGFQKSTSSGGGPTQEGSGSGTTSGPGSSIQVTSLDAVSHAAAATGKSAATPAKITTSPAKVLISTSTLSESAIDTLEFIPLWVQAAVRLGTRFVRVAAAGEARATPYVPSLDDQHASSDAISNNVVDEYYFWIQCAQYYDWADATQDATIGASSATDPSTSWEDPTLLGGLLQWESKPMWHLFWTRVRMGRLDPPRRSDEGVPIDPTTGATPFLSFQGRGTDSLYFTVVAGATATTTTTSNSGTISTTAGGTSGSTTPSPPTGFRYDMVMDTAVLTPQPQSNSQTTGSTSSGSTSSGSTSSGSPITIPGSTGTKPNGTEPSPPAPLTAFPTFVYFQPGKPLIPSSAFGIALSVAGVLRLNCRFEQALRWCQFSFDPLSRNNTWAQCKKQRSDTSNDGRTIDDATAPKPAAATSTPAAVASKPATTSAVKREEVTRAQRDPPCCSCGPVEGGIARARVILLEYVDILLDWGDHLISRNSPEAAEQALVFYNRVERILGARPTEVNAHDKTPSMTVANFKASPAPLNPRLLQLYDRCADRRHLVHDSANSRRLRRGPGFKSCCGSGLDIQSDRHEDGCADMHTFFSRCQPYRFTSILPKAYDWAGMAKGLGSELIAAYEKGDAESLTVLHATQDRQLLDLGLKLVKNQWRAADWDVQALDQAMETALNKLRYYQGLQKAGLNAGETLYVTGVEISTQSRTGATISEGIAQGMTPVPDLAIGVAGMGPYQATQLPIGTKLAKGFSSAARIMNTIGEIASSNAGLAQTEGSWQRRSTEWQNQIDLATIEIQQVKRQQLAAWRRRAVALKQLNNHRQQMQHAAEVQNFMRDKSTKGELYLFLQQETAAQFRQVYDLAMKSAKEVQEALWFERGNFEHNFLTEQMWDDLHEGLLVGERIELALRRMERTYMELNCREYELTKAMSLRLHFPAAFLQLKARGYCKIEIPEWMFDLDHPGHYMRRVKNLTVTVGCVAGPYTGVHCRLQLLSSRIRLRPLLPRREECCCDGADEHENNYYNDDRYIATRHGGTHAIATSTGQEDAGLFLVNFQDERYLPFEYSGAISRWRIELPPENNQFDMDTLTDFVLRLSFTAREGGPELRREANKAAQKHLPGGGVRFFDVRHEFPEAWSVFQMCTPGLAVSCDRQFPLRFTRGMFPFIVGRRAVKICTIHVFIQSGRPSKCASVPVRYMPLPDGECPEDTEFVCVADGDCPGLYHGILQVELGAIFGDIYEEFGYLKFENSILEVCPRDIYLLCDYQNVNDCDRWGNYC